MDKITDFFKSIKERISNPIVFSFIISWVFMNWEITMTLLFDSEIKAIDFIKKQDIHYVFPIVFAIVYTVLSPVISNLVQALQTWCVKWGENWNLTISKGSNIPIEKYLSHKENYDERTQALEKIIKDETKTQQDYEAEKTKRLAAEGKVNEVNNRVVLLSEKISDQERFIGALFDMSYLNGLWLFTNRQNQIKQLIEIKNGDIYYVNGNQRIDKFTIKNYTYDNRNGLMFFAKYSKPETRPKEELKSYMGGTLGVATVVEPSKVYVFVNHLQVLSKDVITGFENQINEVKYERQNP